MLSPYPHSMLKSTELNAYSTVALACVFLKFIQDANLQVQSLVDRLLSHAAKNKGDLLDDLELFHELTMQWGCCRGIKLYSLKEPSQFWQDLV